jgi:hypothetical protein
MTDTESAAVRAHPHASNEDPVVAGSRREAIFILAFTLVVMTYVLTACWYGGYARPAAEIRLYWGVPDWVLAGIIAPWFVCSIVAYIYATLYMRDDDLGEELPENADEFG